MTKRLMQITNALIIIGVVAIALNTLLGNTTVTYLTTYKDQFSGIRFYKFDFEQYIKNLQLATDGLDFIKFETVPRQWQNSSTLPWDALFNNLAFILDYIILILDILLLPIRFMGYLIYNFLAIIGININQNAPLRWLYDLAQFLMNVIIPYV